MPSSTSIENYHEHKSSGRLGLQAQSILDFLARSPNKNWSRAEIADELGIPLSSVCGRINELLVQARITQRPDRPCGMTGKTISPVRISRTEH